VTVTYDTTELRAGILELLEQMRLEECRFGQEVSEEERAEAGSPERWSAKVVLAHVTHFKQEQVTRLRAAADGDEPESFPQVDHQDPGVYAAYVDRSWGEVEAAAERTRVELRELVQELEGELLFTAGIFPWLRGRALWAQVLVRGVWHPSAHLHQYFAEHEHLDRLLELQQGLYQTATSLNIPDLPGGRPFAVYNLACAHSLAGQIDPALDRLAEAIRLDPSLGQSAQTDADLAQARADARFAELVAE
jgi:tetratricopeptide (TPR) repeat protein